MELTDYQQEILSGLLDGSISKDKFGSMRSNARRYSNLQRSVDLAIVQEYYKFKINNKE